MKGIARAAWNNFTGGDTQGASTITQQYARHAAELKEISYNRKLREAVIARKLESKYNKDQIMGMYLNYDLPRRGPVRHRGGGAGLLRQVGDDAGRQEERDHAVRGRGARLDHQAARADRRRHKGYDPNDNPDGRQGALGIHA